MDEPQILVTYIFYILFITNIMGVIQPLPINACRGHLRSWHDSVFVSIKYWQNLLLEINVLNCESVIMLTYKLTCFPTVIVSTYICPQAVCKSIESPAVVIFCITCCQNVVWIQFVDTCIKQFLPQKINLVRVERPVLAPIP